MKSHFRGQKKVDGSLICKLMADEAQVLANEKAAAEQPAAKTRRIDEPHSVSQAPFEGVGGEQVGAVPLQGNAHEGFAQDVGMYVMARTICSLHGLQAILLNCASLSLAWQEFQLRT